MAGTISWTGSGGALGQHPVRRRQWGGSPARKRGAASRGEHRGRSSPAHLPVPGAGAGLSRLREEACKAASTENSRG